MNYEMVIVITLRFYEGTLIVDHNSFKGIIDV